jgi:hypothetical protein
VLVVLNLNLECPFSGAKLVSGLSSRPDPMFQSSYDLRELEMNVEASSKSSTGTQNHGVFTKASPWTVS